MRALWLSLLAGLVAAAGAYLLNWVLVRRMGRNALWLAVPPLEESLKSGLAVTFGGLLPIAHLVFGLIEAAHELTGSRAAPAAAGLAVVTHAGFGGMTAYLASRGPIGPAVLAAAALHSLFNLAIVRRSGPVGRAQAEG